LNDRVQAQVEELAENRVRMTVQVPSHDVHHAVEHATSDLADRVKIPGFRKGKVPQQVLMQRIGRERVMTEAVESHIGGWFWNAATRTRVRPVAQPEFDFQLPASDHEDWEFVATFPVQALPALPDWSTLEVGAIEPSVPEELVQEELDELRYTVAELVPVEGRPVQPEDTVIADLVTPGGETRRDYVIELGRGTVVDEIELALVGMSEGESKDVTFELADGATQTVSLTVKAIKEKVLPQIDDELARSASEFDTLAELRADIEERLLEEISAEVEAQFEADVADALVAASNVQASGALVADRTRAMITSLARRAEAMGVTLDSYLALSGQEPDALVARLQEEAARSLARELVLEAAADSLGIVVDDERVESLVREQAEILDEDPDAQLQRLRESGRFEQLREDLCLSDALKRIAAEVKRIPRELAEAREQIWTPEKEKQQPETKLWTPGQ
jgi:trigger factor